MTSLCGGTSFFRPRSFPIEPPQAPFPAFPHPEMESSCSTLLGCGQEEQRETAWGVWVVTDTKGMTSGMWDGAWEAFSISPSGLLKSTWSVEV